MTKVTSLVGRDREVEVLRDTIAAAAGGRGQGVLIEGEPGIGKTRGSTAGAELGRTAGFEVSLGTCDDLLAARPFAALITALGIRVDASDAERAAIASLVDLTGRLQEALYCLPSTTCSGRTPLASTATPRIVPVAGTERADA